MSGLRKLRFKVGGQVRTVDVAPGQVVHVSPEGELTALDAVGDAELTKYPEIIPELLLRRTIAGSVSNAQVKDRTIETETSSTHVTDYLFGNTFDEVQEWSVHPPLGVISQDGLLSHAANGEVVVVNKSPERVLRKRIALETRTNAPVSRHVEFLSGSLGKHCEDMVDSRLAGADRDDARCLFSLFPSNSNFTDPNEVRGGTDQYVRNPLFWANRSDLPLYPPVDLSCISPGHIASGGVNHKRSPAATLITQQHWVSCAHSSFHPGVGAKVYFVDMANNVHFRTTVAVVNSLTGPIKDLFVVNGQHIDFTVGLLDSPLPAAIKPCSILPVTYPNRLPLPPAGLTMAVPGLALDQQKHGQVMNSQSLGVGGYRHNTGSAIMLGRAAWNRPRSSPVRDAFFDTVYDNRVWTNPNNSRDNRGGAEMLDSGSPSFFIINNALVLVTVWQSPISGACAATYGWLLNEAAAELSTRNGFSPLTISSADLSSFNQYAP